jgi:hypothetical protein
MPTATRAWQIGRAISMLAGVVLAATIAAFFI